MLWEGCLYTFLLLLGIYKLLKYQNYLNIIYFMSKITLIPKPDKGISNENYKLRSSWT